MVMRCCEELGDRREGVRMYERLVTVLRRQLDAEPDDETVALAGRLQGGISV